MKQEDRKGKHEVEDKYFENEGGSCFNELTVSVRFRRL